MITIERRGFLRRSYTVRHDGEVIGTAGSYAEAWWMADLARYGALPEMPTEEEEMPTWLDSPWVMRAIYAVIVLAYGYGLWQIARWAS